MVLLGRVEGPGGHELCDDEFLERLALFQRCQRCLRGSGLRCVVGEDGGAVGRAGVAKLSVLGGGVDAAPELLEQLRVAHLGGIEDDLHRFGMARALARDLLVSGTLL